MPELAEVALMAVEVNRHARHVFHAVKRSHVQKLGTDLPLPRCWRTFRLEARSRGKEMRMDVWPVAIDAKVRKQEEKERAQKAKEEAKAKEGKEADEEEDEEKMTPRKRKRTQALNGHGKPFVRIHAESPTIPLDGPLPLLFRMGMTGHIQSFPSHADTHKHAHLTFLSSEPSDVAVCFVDQRQFGRWLVTDRWDATRGPCPLTEYTLFRAFVLDSLEARPMQKPLCEVLLNQAYFNGIGNYLRAEICHRAGVNPFASAAVVLARLVGQEDRADEPDTLRLCHDVPAEAFGLGYRYGSMNNEEAVRQAEDAERKVDEDAEAQRVKEEAEEEEGDEKAERVEAPTVRSRKSFSQWLQCYEKHALGMLSTVDGLGRAMWHSNKWRVSGKTKAGSRRPKKGKTISGAKREEEEEGEGGAAQVKEEEADETGSGRKKRKSASSKKAARGKQVKAEDEQKEQPAEVAAKRSSSRKRAAVKDETDETTGKAKSKGGKKREAASPAADDSADGEQVAQRMQRDERRRSGRLTALKELEQELLAEREEAEEEDDEEEEEEQSAPVARAGKRKPAASKKGARKGAKAKAANARRTGRK